MANRRKDRDKSSESLKDKLNHLKQSGKIYMDGLSRIWKNVQVAVDNQQFDDIASKMKI